MALTGIQIFKLLPKTNCKECGVPTCLAFAMNLAASKTELNKCPYVSEEAKNELFEASAPLIRSVTIGEGKSSLKLGGETVLYRHEKSFNNPCKFAASINDNDKNFKEKITRWRGYSWERVGIIMQPEMVFLKYTSGDINKYTTSVEIIDESGFTPILACEDLSILSSVVKKIRNKKAILYAATITNIVEIINIVKDNNLPLIIKGNNLDEVITLVKNLDKSGIKDIIIDSGSRDLSSIFYDNIIIRRSALLKQNRIFGYPIINFANAISSDLAEQTIAAAAMLAKYASIIVLDDFQAESIYPLLLERLNIYTDPQRPMTVTQGIYDIGGPDHNSPIAITTNFSLTYFIISGEIESSRVPTWLLIKDTEGLSVMTAWAAGKFSGDDVGLFVKKSGIDQKVKHKTIIIPGYAASIAGDLEDVLNGWKIKVGPREAAHLPKFLKNWKV